MSEEQKLRTEVAIKILKRIDKLSKQAVKEVGSLPHAGSPAAYALDVLGKTYVNIKRNI